MSLVDDLTVEREEGGLLRSTLEHVVAALGLSGGLTLTLGEDGSLATAAETRAASLDPALVHEMAQAAIDRGAPRAARAGGWRLAGRGSPEDPSAPARGAPPLRPARRQPGPRPRPPGGPREAGRQRSRQRPPLRRAARVLAARRGAEPHHLHPHLRPRPQDRDPALRPRAAGPRSLRPPGLRLRQRHGRLHRDRGLPRGPGLGHRQRDPRGGQRSRLRGPEQQGRSCRRTWCTTTASSRTCACSTRACAPTCSCP